MALLRLLKSEPLRALWLILVMTTVSGAANAALVALINAGADAVRAVRTATLEFALFLVALLVFLYFKSLSENWGKDLMENAMSKLRVRLYDKILKARLAAIESLEAGELIGRTSRNINQVLQLSDNIIYGLQSCVMLVFCMIYLAYLSPYAFGFVSVGVLIIGTLRNMRNQSNWRANLEMIQREGQQAKLLGDAVEGFKEMKVSHAKNRDLFRVFSESVEETKKVSVAVSAQYIQSRIVMQASFFIILAFVVFAFPRFVSTYTERVLQITSVVLFVVGYLSGFVEMFPVFSRANAAAQNLFELEDRLEKSQEEVPGNLAELQRELENFSAIEARDLTFSYRDASGETQFSVGPINLKIQRGEVIFLVGGNGSGKSTFLKLLTGLYQPAGGGLVVDQKRIDEASIFALRELYSVIFADFHMFDHFYGYGQVDEERVNELIKLMRLEGKVSFSNNAFSTTKLSTGQRKRLALIASMLEDKPIYIFDEWAAEQDQHFRQFFYGDILDDLRRRNKTVIVVSHDDAYWGAADRIVKLDCGRVVEDSQ